MLNAFTGLFNTDREKDVLLRRARGEKLENIGKELGVTRERTRQIESNPKQKIEKWLLDNKEEIINLFFPDNAMNEQAVISSLGQENVEIIKYVIRKNKKNPNFPFKALNGMDVIYIEENDDLRNLLSETKDFYTLNRSHNIVQDFTSSIRNKGYGFWTSDMTVLYFNSVNCHVCGDILHVGRLTLGNAINYVSIEDFPDGIKISNQSQMEEFVSLVRSKFGMNVKNDHSFLVRLQDVLVLKGKGEYVSADNISWNFNLIKKIAEYVNNSEDAQISFNQLYITFKEELNKNGIKNHYGLQGIIRRAVDLGIITIGCTRYYASKSERKNISSDLFFKPYYEFLKGQAKPVNIKEIREKFPTWTSFYFQYAQNYFPGIVPWTTDSYFCLDAISFTEDAKSGFYKSILETLDNNYTNCYKAFDYMSKNLPEILNTYKINNKDQLYCVLQHIFGDKFLFRKPHIVRDWKDSKFSIEDLVAMVIDENKIFNKQEIVDRLTSLYGERNSTLTLSLQRKMSEYKRISETEYTKPDNLVLTEKECKELKKNLLDASISGEVILPNTLDFSKFISVPFKWNAWLLLALVEVNDVGFKVIGKPSATSQTPLTIIVSKNSKLSTKNDVFKWLVKNDYSGDNEISDIFHYAQATRMFQTNLTTKDIEDIM